MQMNLFIKGAQLNEPKRVLRFVHRETRCNGHANEGQVVLAASIVHDDQCTYNILKEFVIQRMPFLIYNM